MKTSKLEELSHVQAQIQRYEQKYSTTLATLLQQGLPYDADYQMHEDFIEWEFWVGKLRRVESN